MILYYTYPFSLFTFMSQWHSTVSVCTQNNGSLLWLTIYYIHCKYLHNLHIKIYTHGKSQSGGMGDKGPQMFLSQAVLWLQNLKQLDNSSNFLLQHLQCYCSYKFQFVEHDLISSKSHLPDLTKTQVFGTSDTRLIFVLSNHFSPNFDYKASCYTSISNGWSCCGAHFLESTNFLSFCKK